MESRDLPSGMGLHPGPAMRVHPPVSQASRAAVGPFSIDPTVLAGIINRLYGSNPPTPAEVKRQTFVAKFVAQYTVSAPRFSDRASTIYGVTSGDVVVSNQFHKGRAQFVLFPPANPGATPDLGNPYANQVTGQAALFDENFLQTGNLLILDLNGTPGSEVNGLPTHMIWNFDTASGGAYTGVSGFLQGGGVVDFKYSPDAIPKPGTTGSGTVLVTFQGLLNQSQIVNAVAKIYS